MLEEGDEDERMAHSEVGHTVNGHYLPRSRPVDEDSKLEDDTDVADDDLVVLVRGGNDGQRWSL